MNLKNIIIAAFGLLVIMPINLHSKLPPKPKPRIITQSKTAIKATSSTIVNKSTTCNLGQLNVQVSQDAALEGVSVNFQGGGYTTNGGSQNTFSGSYNPATGTTTILNSSFQCLPGGVNYPVTVSGNAALEGVGNLSNGISLANASTNLTINSQSVVNSNINLNGGSTTLNGGLSFSGGNQPIGIGSIIGNGNSVVLGGRDLIMTSTLSWFSTDIVANSRLTSYGTWNLYGDIHVMGRGNVLDLSSGGKVVIEPHSRVYVANLNIKGLGPGTIQFLDNTGQLVLSSCTIELLDDYTFHQGGVYIDSTSTIITGSNLLTFDTNASMTVNGETLWYDTLTFDDNNNIRPTRTQDPNEKFIAYLNNGQIRRIEASSGGGGGDHYYVSDVSLTGFTVYSPNARAFFDASVSLTGFTVYSPNARAFFDASISYDGNDNVAYFASSRDPISFVADGVTVVFSNVRLQNYAPSFTQMGTDSSIIFGDGTVIDLGMSDDLNMTWTFLGQCVLRGNGQTLNLGDYGAIVVQGAGSSLILDDINITGVSGNKILCTDDTTTISLRNVLFVLDNDYSFTIGRFDVLDKFELSGAAAFNYQTSGQSSIASGGELFIDIGTTFSYAPLSTDNRDLIAMVDPSSIIYLNGATLVSSTTGLRLTKGTVIVDKVNYIDNPGAISISQGVEFGDGTVPGELFVNVVPGGRIELLSGCFNIN